MSLYAHFGSKDNLATEYVIDADRSFDEWFEERMALAPADARARLLHAFDVLAEWVKSPASAGVPSSTRRSS